MLSEILTLSPRERNRLWRITTSLIEQYHRRLPTLPVSRCSRKDDIDPLLNQIHLGTPGDPEALIRQVFEALENFQLHTAHPMYFGVFNPHPSFMGILGELLSASFNTQLASTASGLVAIEMERRSLSYLADMAGWHGGFDGTFCSGGSEANLTAILCALNLRFPEVRSVGLRSVKQQPKIYISSEGHHSIHKAARISGLGTQAVVEIPVEGDLTLAPLRLKQAVSEDIANGAQPLLVIATLGSTSSGANDPLSKIQQIAQDMGLWLHVDCAWAGAALLLPEFQAQFTGLPLADSLTIDAHKWFSVPMTAGIFLTRHEGILEKTFRTEDSPYMPPEASSSKLIQPYNESIPWSRRFMGLKFYLTLALAGEAGYQAVFRHQIAMGEHLRSQLAKSRWEIRNQTPWPVVCFTHPTLNGIRGPTLELVDRIQKSGEAWITSTRLTSTQETVIRAGISSFSTEITHVERLVEILNRATREGPTA